MKRFRPFRKGTTEHDTKKRKLNPNDLKEFLSVGRESVPSRSETEKQKREGDFYCNVCKLWVSDEPSHRTSTIHNFNMEHEEVPKYGIPENNLGYRMLKGQGWTEGDALGKEGFEGRHEPIATRLKNNRLGIGMEHEKFKDTTSTKKVTHFKSHYGEGPIDKECLPKNKGRMKTLSKKKLEKEQKKEEIKQIKSLRRELKKKSPPPLVVPSALGNDYTPPNSDDDALFLPNAPHQW